MNIFKKLILSLMISLLSIFTFIPFSVNAAAPPEPTYATATVDGNISEWNLAEDGTGDFFTNMYIAGINDANHPLSSKTYIRYDVTTETVYLLVLTFNNFPALADDANTVNAWVKVDGINGNVVRGDATNDNYPPDFAWVYNSQYPEGSGYAWGFESSFYLPPLADNTTTFPVTYLFRSHIEVENNGAATSASSPASTLTWKALTLNPPVVPLEHPSISIGKTTNGSDSEMILVGDPVTWSYLVTNNGDVGLSDINIVDDQIGQIGSIDYLGVGQSQTLISLGTAIKGAYSNLATVAGTSPGGQLVSATDGSSYFGADPSIVVDKTTNGSDGPVILVGDAITWSYTVTNNGNVDLSQIAVDDDKLGNIGFIDSLAVGESQTLTYSGVAEAGSYNNVATVNATSPVNTISATDESSYFGAAPAISIITYVSVDGGITWLDANSAPYPQILVGDSVMYKLVVSNTGNIVLNDVLISDPQLGINQSIGSLDPDESFTIISDPVIVIYGDNINTATASGIFSDYQNSVTTYSSTESASYFGTLVSYTQGGYAGKGLPGQILLTNFSTLFPNGLTIGHYSPINQSPFGILWNDTNSLRQFLASGGPSQALMKDYLNPVSIKTDVIGGTLSRQAVALELNISFSGNVLGMPSGFDNLIYSNPGNTLDGMTVQQILDISNNALATGVLPADYSFGSLNQLLTSINQAFDNGVATIWAQQYLK